MQRVVEARPERRDDRDREQRCGQREEDVGEPHQDVVDPSAGRAGGDADHAADHHARRDHLERGEPGRAHAVEHREKMSWPTSSVPSRKPWWNGGIGSADVDARAFGLCGASHGPTIAIERHDERAARRRPGRPTTRARERRAGGSAPGRAALRRVMYGSATAISRAPRRSAAVPGRAHAGARPFVVRPERDRDRDVRATLVERDRATRMERATRRRPQRARGLAGEAATAALTGHRVEQRACVRVARIGGDHVGRTLLDDPARGTSPRCDRRRCARPRGRA